MIKESADGLVPIVMTPDQRRDLTRKAAVRGVESLFPIIGTHKEIHMSNPRVLNKNHGYEEHKKALMTGGSLVEPLVADVTIKDKKTGKVLDRKNKHTLLQLPYATENHTFVVKGIKKNLVQISEDTKLNYSLLIQRVQKNNKITYRKNWNNFRKILHNI